jgi:hypothetical protein
MGGMWLVCAKQGEGPVPTLSCLAHAQQVGWAQQRAGIYLGRDRSFVYLSWALWQMVWGCCCLKAAVIASSCEKWGRGKQ